MNFPAEDVKKYKGILGELVVLQELIRRYEDREHVADIFELDYIYKVMTMEGTMKFRKASVQHGMLVNHVMDYMVKYGKSGSWKFIEVKSTVFPEKVHFRLNGDQYKYLQEPGTELAVVRLPKIEIPDYSYERMQEIIDQSTIEFYWSYDLYYKLGNVIINNKYRRQGRGERRSFKERIPIKAGS